MGQGMRVTVDAAMRARDVCRIRPQDDVAESADEPPARPGSQPVSQPAAQPTKARRGEKRRLAKRRTATT